MSRPRISDYRLERLAAGDLPAVEAEALRAEMHGDPEELARFEAIEQSTAELLAALPPGEVHAEVMRRVAAAPEAPPRGPWVDALRAPPVWAAVAACAVVAVVVLGPPEDDGPGVRTKGGPALAVHRVVGADTEQLADGDSASAGDRIQVSVLGAAQRHAVVVSIDGAGRATLHYPLPADEPGPIAGVLFPLPRSYELDDAEGFERFLVVAADEPLDANAILEGARRLAKDDEAASRADLPGLPESGIQASFLLLKTQ